MLPEDTKRSIYQSMPAGVNIEGREYPAVVAWAVNANVPLLLKEASIVATIRMSADRTDKQNSSPGQLLGVASDGGSISQHFSRLVFSKETSKSPSLKYIRGVYRLVTLTIDVHTRDVVGIIAAESLINAYMEQLQIWALSTLHHLSGVIIAEDLGVMDLSYPEDGMFRREMMLYLRYVQSYAEPTPVVEDVQYDIDIL